MAARDKKSTCYWYLIKYSVHYLFVFQCRYVPCIKTFSLSFNGYGHLHCPAPADIDEQLNEAAADKLRDYRADYSNCNSKSISFMPAVASTSGRLHCERVRILFVQTHMKNDCPLFCSFTSSKCATQPGLVPLPPRCFLLPLQTKGGNILSKARHCVSTLTSMMPLSLHAHTPK